VKTIATCRDCGTNLIGEKLNQIAGNYYCHAHYSIQQDKPANRKTESNIRKFKGAFNPYNNLLDTDFDNWTATNITVSGKNLTSSAGGSILISTEMAWGESYNLSTRITKNGIGVKFYNYSSSPSITDEIKENGSFISLGDTIILAMDSGGTITVENLILVGV